jgi:hypothetical protein
MYRHGVNGVECVSLVHKTSNISVDGEMKLNTRVTLRISREGQGRDDKRGKDEEGTREEQGRNEGRTKEGEGMRKERGRNKGGTREEGGGTMEERGRDEGRTREGQGRAREVWLTYPVVVLRGEAGDHQAAS